MHNFGTLYYYELKKILKKKMVWITWGIVFGCILLMGVWDILFESYEENGKKISGYEKMIEDRESARALSGEIIDDTEFYQTRTNDIVTLWSDQKLTEEEIAYWKEKEAKIQMPFVYEYTTGFENFLDFLYNIQFFIVMLIGISLAGVFADEHLRRTDQVILGSRFGKKTLYFAKLAAGVTFGVGSTALFQIITAGLSLAVYGADGFHGAIQLVLIQSSWKISIGEAALCLSALTLVIAVFLCIVTMFLSEGLKSSIAAMALISGTWMFTFFINIPYSHRIFSQALSFLPSKIMRAGGWADMRLIGIFGKYLTAYQFAPVLYLLVTVLLIFLGRGMYERFQISGR